MGQEIERKFLVRGDYRSQAYSSSHIVQGYLCSSARCTVRIRLRDDKGYVTIKGKSDAAGLSRSEWEQEIPFKDASEMLALCGKEVIDKTRHLVKAGSHTFEVDEFHGDNEGLVVAEVELGSENEEYERPSWLGEEVTGDRKYYNSHLVDSPFKSWTR